MNLEVSLNTARDCKTPCNAHEFQLSCHAQNRMGSRGITLSAIEKVLEYGRMVYANGARIFVVGRKEAERYRARGVDLFPYEGIHVVCNAKESTILTTYRNRNLRRLRPRRRARRHSRR